MSDKSYPRIAEQVNRIGRTTIDFDEYQQRSKRTALEHADPDTTSEADHKHTALFLATALNGEVGELSEKVKKYVREEDETYLDDAEAELGDILWYLSQLASLLDVRLSDVAEENLAKLEDRQRRDVLTGSGDDR